MYTSLFLEWSCVYFFTFKLNLFFDYFILSENYAHDQRVAAWIVSDREF